MHGTPLRNECTGFRVRLTSHVCAWFPTSDAHTGLPEFVVADVETDELRHGKSHKLDDRRQTPPRVLNIVVSVVEP